MSRWRRRIRESLDARIGANATVTAVRLMQEGASDEEVVAGLRAIPGGQDELAAVAGVMAKSVDKGYPFNRLHRVLSEAAGLPMPATTAEERLAEAEQRKLRDQPSAVSFEQLATQLPALRRLEVQARNDPESFVRELTFRESGMIGKTLPRNQRDRELRIAMGIDKAVSALIGPGSSAVDSVAKSDAAASAVSAHLQQVAGIQHPTHQVGLHW
jgi:hypothetical protein